MSMDLYALWKKSDTSLPDNPKEAEETPKTPDVVTPPSINDPQPKPHVPVAPGIPPGPPAVSSAHPQEDISTENNETFLDDGGTDFEFYNPDVPATVMTDDDENVEDEDEPETISDIVSKAEAEPEIDTYNPTLPQTGILRFHDALIFIAMALMLAGLCIRSYKSKNGDGC